MTEIKNFQPPKRGIKANLVINIYYTPFLTFFCCTGCPVTAEINDTIIMKAKLYILTASLSSISVIVEREDDGELFIDICKYLIHFSYQFIESNVESFLSF